MRGLRRGGSAGADVRERWGARALSRARHGGGEVAAAELDGVAWRAEERSSAVGSGTRGSRKCRVGRWSSRRWPTALHNSSAAAQLRRQVKQRGREVEEDCWTFLQFLKNPGILL